MYFTNLTYHCLFTIGDDSGPRNRAKKTQKSISESKTNGSILRTRSDNDENEMLDDDNDPSTSDMPELIVDSDSDTDEEYSDMTDGDESEEEDIDDTCRNLEWNFDKAHLCSSIDFDIESHVTQYAKRAIKRAI